MAADAFIGLAFFAFWLGALVVLGVIGDAVFGQDPDLRDGGWSPEDER